jgi:AcrR family transcriptional regulator
MRSSSTGPTKRREVLSRDARVQRIFAASQRVFASRPYDEIAIDDIAAEAGMSKGLLYHYFSSKRDLYLETLRQVLATISQITEDQRDLHACLSTLLSYFEQSPALARMVFRGGIGSDAEVEALLVAYRQRQLSLFFQRLNTAASDPLVRLGLAGWISFFQEVCLQWLEQQTISREQVLVLLEHSLRAILSSVAQRGHNEQWGVKTRQSDGRRKEDDTLGKEASSRRCVQEREESWDYS